MLNRTILAGRLTRDPEMRTTQSGKSVASFSLAVERDVKGPDGERETDFFDFVAWGGTADFVCKYFSKGRVAIVDGRLQSRAWKDKDGNNRKAVEIRADYVYFGDSKPQNTEGSNNSFPAFNNDFEEYEDISGANEPLPF